MTGNAPSTDVASESNFSIQSAPAHPYTIFQSRKPPRSSKKNNLKSSPQQRRKREINPTPSRKDCQWNFLARNKEIAESGGKKLTQAEEIRIAALLEDDHNRHASQIHLPTTMEIIERAYGYQDLDRAQLREINTKLRSFHRSEEMNDTQEDDLQEDVVDGFTLSNALDDDVIHQQRISRQQRDRLKSINDSLEILRRENNPNNRDESGNASPRSVYVIYVKRRRRVVFT